MRRLVLSTFLVSGYFWGGLGISFAADFVGPETCKSCHQEAYEAWSQSQHARAKQSLSATERTDPRCTSCHSPNESDRHVENVSCESCHGGGEHYAVDYVMRDAELARLVGMQDSTDKTCRTCHDASSPSLSGFNYPEKLKLIDHWSAHGLMQTPKKKSQP